MESWFVGSLPERNDCLVSPPGGTLSPIMPADESRNNTFDLLVCRSGRLRLNNSIVARS